MPNPLELTRTTQGRRQLLQWAVGATPYANEIAFLICAMYYRSQPTMNRALIIHALFLQNAHNGLSGDKKYMEYNVRKDVVGRQAYKNYLNTFGTNVSQSMATAHKMPKLFRVITSPFRKAPQNLYDAMIQKILDKCGQNATDQFFALAKQAINGFRLGNQGGGQKREQGTYKMLVNWAKTLGTQLNHSGCFNAKTLGITDVFSPANLT